MVSRGQGVQGRRLIATGHRELFEIVEISSLLMVVVVARLTHFFKTHQLHAKREWILSYVIYISIKLLIKKRNVFKFFLSIDAGGCP